MSNCSCKWGGCTPSKVCTTLLVIGGLNWGLIGLGMLFGATEQWNFVSMLLSSMPVLEAIVYLLVGVAGVMKLIGCKCDKCKALCASCDSCQTGGGEQKMQ